MLATIKEKTKEDSKIWVQAKILEHVVATTKLGDKLVELQLLYLG